MDNYKITYTLEDYKRLATIGTFYDIPQFCEDEEDPWFMPYCRWFISGGKVVRNIGTPEEKLVRIYSGSIKEEIFDTFEKKVAYLQGIFESYAGSTLNKYYLNFANSSVTVERVQKLADEIAHRIGLVEMSVYRHGHFSIPLCNEVTLSPKLIDFIQKFNINAKT